MLSLANSVTITNSDGNLVGTNITLVSGSIFALRSSTGCGTQVYLKGVISGSFGKVTTDFHHCGQHQQIHVIQP